MLTDRVISRLRASASVPDLTGKRYRLLEPIGRGGMGAVYRVEDESLGRRVALKVLDLPDSSGELAARLLREARILAQLEHPGIVPVHDVGTLADGRVFYTMKFVQGRRLDQHVGQLPSMTDRLRLFQRICEPVAFAHARGVLHRDLKPENVMVGPFGEVLLMDWGVAKILGDSTGAGETLAAAAPPPVREETSDTAHGAVLGTPGYMSPEQARGEVDRLDARSDVYSLGAIMRFLLASQPRIPKPLAAICEKASAAEPGARYASAEELFADVGRYLDGQAVRAYPENLMEKLERLWPRVSFWVVLALTYLVIRAVILIFQIRAG